MITARFGMSGVTRSVTRRSRFRPIRPTSEPTSVAGLPRGRQVGGLALAPAIERAGNLVRPYTSSLTPQAVLHHRVRPTAATRDCRGEVDWLDDEPARDCKRDARTADDDSAEKNEAPQSVQIAGLSRAGDRGRIGDLMRGKLRALKIRHDESYRAARPSACGSHPPRAANRVLAPALYENS